MPQDLCNERDRERERKKENENCLDLMIELINLSAENLCHTPPSYYFYTM